MPRIGLEPTHLAAPDPKSGVSTNSTIWARCSSLPCLAIYANTSVFSHTIEMQMEVLILVVLSTLKEMRRKKPAAFTCCFYKREACASRQENAKTFYKHLYLHLQNRVSTQMCCGKFRSCLWSLLQRPLMAR